MFCLFFEVYIRTSASPVRDSRSSPTHTFAGRVVVEVWMQGKATPSTMRFTTPQTLRSYVCCPYTTSVPFRSKHTRSLLQTAGFVWPSSVAPRSITAHRAAATTAVTTTTRRKPSCLQRQQGRRAGVCGGSNHALGARRRDDFFNDDDDLYDDLDDRFSPAPQTRKRPKVPLLPATLSKVSSF